MFVATLDARVIALNATTGKQVWQVHAADGASGYSFITAPLIADGKVVVGVRKDVVVIGEMFANALVSSSAWPSYDSPRSG